MKTVSLDEPENDMPGGHTAMQVRPSTGAWNTSKGSPLAVEDPNSI